MHLIRYSMQFASWKERKLIAAALKPIYRADSAQDAERELQTFDEGIWGKKYPAIAQSWRRNWTAVIPFFAFPAEVRKIIYTTNAIESLNASVRKAVRNKGHFPSDQAATKLIWLALRNITENWKRPPIAWQAAKAQLAIQFGERFTFNDWSMQPALTQDFLHSRRCCDYLQVYFIGGYGTDLKATTE